MLINTTIAVAIMAFLANAAPAPQAPAPSASSMPSATPTSNRTDSAPAAPLPSDITRQLFLADTAADRYTLLPENRNFVFNFNDSTRLGRGGRGGDLIPANRKTFAPLVGTGSGMAVGFLKGCGFNTPHVHPRATELQIVVKGRVITEMVPENGVFNVPGQPSSGRRVIRNELGPFQMQPFYQGSVHSQYNPDCEEAQFVASFNSEDFGTGPVADELAALDAETFTAAFGEAVNAEDLERFRRQIPASIALGVASCLQKCNLTRSY
ncbi:hypothetical protein HYFRA_00005090 [Hymenoscyphus fraxineus]|uniref:Cupin type-1 domain-containing protein n=1 Tax=Hymenoscyphus fraxineus TaxID=746836 RepID=A0A9N9Q0D9_9HELO|nr:hypothetical protein HYFRA_00005090 [Hymenoscyphus fraxineus]